MQAQSLRALHHVCAWVFLIAATLVAGGAYAAPYAAMVMDARNGEVIFARNHDTRLHPASLTKMMTIYVAFEAIKHGEVTLDTQFTVSRRASGTACVCLGLRPGQKISLRYLIRAAALRSANDATVVIAEGISGSVEAFAERMTRTARAMGMNNTTFRNPHGLTQTGHVSTARDMTILGRQLYFDYPQYFNIFSRRSDSAGVAVVPNTNRRFLDAYAGADGIKTGYTRAAGFNLTASAKRGGRHIIATMFGGTSTAQRNAHVAELLDIGFNRAAARVATRAPRTPAYQGSRAVASAPQSSGQAARGDDDPSAAAKTIRLQMAVRRSPRPTARPTPEPAEDLLIAVRESVDSAVQEATSEHSAAGVAPEVLPVAPPVREEVAQAVAEAVSDPAPDAAIEDQIAEALEAGFAQAEPEAEPHALDPALADQIAEALEAGFSLADAETPEAEAAPDADAAITVARVPPRPRPDALVVPATEAAAEVPEAHAETATQPSEIALSASSQPDADAVWIGASDTIISGLTPPADPLPAPTEALADATPDRIDADLDMAPSAPQRPSGIILTSGAQTTSDADARQAIANVVEASVASENRVINLVATSDGGRLWGVSLGQFNSRAAAERGVIAVKMAEAQSLANGVSRIQQVSGRFEASFAGLTQSEAERACLRLTARAMDCNVAHP